MGKGDRQRPVDKKKYDENYDKIFKKKPPKDKLLDEGFHRLTKKNSP